MATLTQTLQLPPQERVDLDSRAPSLRLSSTEMGKIANGMTFLTPDAKQAMSKDYSTAEECHDAVLTVSRSCNEFLSEQANGAKVSSAGLYTLRTLQVYDDLVWKFNAPLLWRIEQGEIQRLYNECITPNHCEVAVGTGLFLMGVPNLSSVTLLDLNPNTMEVCKQRLLTRPEGDALDVKLVTGNIIEDGDDTDDRFYDSIAANYLIHCLHGGDDTTRRAFSNIAQRLNPENEQAVFFGSTILGQDLNVDADNAGPATLETNALYNKIGIFGNESDSFEGIEGVLNEIYEDVEIWRAGYCAVWKARKPTKSA